MADNETKYKVVLEGDESVKAGFKGIAKSIESTSKQIAKTFNQNAQVVRNFGAGLSATVTAPVLLAGGAAVKAASDYEQLTVAFETMLGSAEKAQSLMGDISTFAAQTPFELKDIEQASKSMLAFGVASENIIPNLESIGNIASGVGIPITDLAVIFGKARTQGTLFAEDINQLTERGVPIITQLAKQFGVAEAEIKKLVSEGKVGFEDLQAAFESMAGEGGQFNNLMAKQAKTTAGQWSNLQDTLHQLSIEIGQMILPLAKKFISRISGLVNWFKELEPNVKRNILVFAGIAAAIGPLLLILGQLVIAVTAALPIFAAIGTFLAGPIPIIAGLVVAITLLMKHFGMLQPIINGARGMFEKLKATFDVLKQAFMSNVVQGAIVKLRVAFVRVVEALSPLFEKLKELTIRILEPFAKINEGEQSLFSLQGAITVIIAAIEGFVFVIDKILVPTITVIVAVIGKVVDAYLWWTDQVEKVWKFFSNFGENLRLLWDGIKQTFIQAIERIGLKLENFFFYDIPYFIGAAIRFFMDLPKQIPDIIEKMKDLTIEVFFSLWDWINVNIPLIINSIIKFVSQLPIKALEHINNFVQKFKDIDLKQAGIDAVKGFLNGLNQKFKDIINWAKEAAGKFVGAFNKGLGNQSPSWIFELAGDNALKGFGIGINQTMDTLIKSTTSRLDTFVSIFNSKNLGLDKQIQQLNKVAPEYTTSGLYKNQPQVNNTGNYRIENNITLNVPNNVSSIDDLRSFVENELGNIFNNVNYKV